MRLVHVLAISSALLGVCLGGCSHDSGPQDSPQQKADADRMTEIQRKTGGDWSKLTDADKKWLLDQCGGNENSAKMLLGPPKVHIGPPAGASGGPGK